MRIASRFRISGIFSHLYFFLNVFTSPWHLKWPKCPLHLKHLPGSFIRYFSLRSVAAATPSRASATLAVRRTFAGAPSPAGQRPPVLHRPLSPPPSSSPLALQSAAIPIHRPALRSSCSKLGFRLDPKRRLGSWARQSACAHGSRTPRRRGSWRGAAPAASPAAPTALVAEPVRLVHVNGDVRGTGNLLD